MTTKQIIYVVAFSLVVAFLTFFIYFLATKGKSQTLTSKLIPMFEKKPKYLTASVLGASTTPTACITTTDQTNITNIQNQIKTMTTTVSSMSPQPTSDVLSSFNSAISSINTQIASLLAFPTCSSFCTGGLVYNSTTGMCSCPSGQNSYINTSGNIACTTSTCTETNQQYNPADGTCRCINPYGLDSSGNCSIPCTFSQATWSGQACGCNAGYTLTSAMNVCDNPSNDTINNTYLPQISQLVSTLSSISRSIPLVGYTIPNITSTGTYCNPPSSQFFSLPVTSNFTISFNAVAPNNVDIILSGTQSVTGGYIIAMSGWNGTQSGIWANSTTTSAQASASATVNWAGILTSPGSNNQFTVTVNKSVGTITIGGTGLTHGFTYQGNPLTAINYIGFSDYGVAVTFSNILVTYQYS